MDENLKSGRALLITIAIVVSVATPFLVLVAETVGAYTSSNTIAGSVVVPPTCYISISANSLNFGSLAPGAYANNGYTSNYITDSDMGGNVGANVLIYGTDWIAGSSNFGVGNTLWAGANILDTSANALLLSPGVNTGLVVTPSSGNNIYFGLEIPSGQASGTYTQNIIVTNSC